MKLLIIDDHPIVREGLAALLHQIGPDTTVLAAADAAEGLRLAGSHRDIDIVLLDLALPGIDGMAAIGEFGKVRPELPIVVLSASEDPEEVRRALANGALGFVPKSMALRTLLSAVQLVLSGDIYVPPLMICRADLPSPKPRADSGPNPLPRLTDRQMEVLRLLARGLPTKTISDTLGLADQTVKHHITEIFKALNVVNRTQATNAAKEIGLI
jgi:two-component system nitrate/nitrite response regulator NarL